MACSKTVVLALNRALLKANPQVYTLSAVRFSTTNRQEADRKYKLLIVGGGSGGTAVANTFASKLGDKNVAVVEPSPDHYYQPIWTLVGAGIKTFEQSRRTTKELLPKSADWLQDRAVRFDPDNNKVFTEKGDEIEYEYLLVAMGLQLNFDTIKGAVDALENDPCVSSNYSPKYVHKTFPALENFKEGNAVFTFPNAPIKCAGAPQKAAYLADDYFRRVGKRNQAKIIYNTSLPAIFGIPKYAQALMKIVNSRDIILNTRTNLIEVKPETKEAVFAKLDSETGETETFPYSFLHIAPPCSVPDVLKESCLVDSTGFLDVSKSHLQHNKYPNVFGIGDCTSAPTAKTAAAVAAQMRVIKKSLTQVMNGEKPDSEYDGYTSCPLITSNKHVILAEFGYDGKVLETFPFNQARESRIMYQLKANVMPHMYFRGLVKGMWHGPAVFRKMFNIVRFTKD